MTCLTALLMFLDSHSMDNSKLGWVLGEYNKWAYTWVVTEKNNIHYWSYGHGPDDSVVPLKKIGNCFLPNGKSVSVLEYSNTLPKVQK